MRCWKLRKGRLPIGPSSDGASENVDSLHTPDLLDRSCSLFDSSCGLHRTSFPSIDQWFHRNSVLLTSAHRTSPVASIGLPESNQGVK